MFKGLSNFSALLQQAKQMGGRVQQLQEELKKRRTVGTAGGSLVEIEANGQLEITRCRLSEQMLAEGDRELMEELIMAAVNQALANARQLQAEAMRELTGGLDLPGLTESVSKLFQSAKPDEGPGNA